MTLRDAFMTVTLRDASMTVTLRDAFMTVTLHDAPEMGEVVGRDDAAACQEPGPEGEGAV